MIESMKNLVTFTNWKGTFVKYFATKKEAELFIWSLEKKEVSKIKLLSS